MSTRVDELVERLHASMRNLGVSIPGPPQDISVLDEIDEALAPAALPYEVRRLWELVDANQLVNSVRTHPELADPAFCLHGHKNLFGSQDFVGVHPGHFFQVFYTSHDEMSVECDGPGWEGGCLFEWFLSDPADPFVLRFLSVGDWLEVLLVALEEGAYQDLGNSILLIDHARHQELAAQRLACGRSHPQYGTRIEIPRDRSHWPDYWLRREQVVLNQC